MRKSRLSWHKQNRLIEHFIAGTTSRTAASLVGVNKTTASYYFHRLRTLIYQNYYNYETIDKDFNCISLCLDTLEGIASIREKERELFGIISYKGKVFTEMTSLSKAKKSPAQLLNAIQPDSLVCIPLTKRGSTISVSDLQHHRFYYQYAPNKKASCLNEIEKFWSLLSRHLYKFNGIPKDNFYLYLRECEWRFNTGDPKLQLILLKQWLSKKGK